MAQRFCSQNKWLLLTPGLCIIVLRHFWQHRRFVSKTYDLPAARSISRRITPRHRGIKKGAYFMKQYTADKIRNVAIAGHGGSGKTSLAEAMLYRAGATDRLGRTADGNTVCDCDQEDRKSVV